MEQCYAMLCLGLAMEHKAFASILERALEHMCRKPRQKDGKTTVKGAMFHPSSIRESGA